MMSTPPPSGHPPLHIRLLGGLRLSRDGRELTLPASKKTRALLGYLIATGQPHRRERLCDLLWDGPDDPRAELRWSVSKLRPCLNTAHQTHLVTDREHIGFAPLNATVDLMTLQHVVSDGIAATATERLREAAALVQGEFLDGLDLPLCYRYQEWCLAEREAASRLHRAILAALVERLAEQPDEALPIARRLIATNPLAEDGHAAVIRLLGRLGQRREAVAHYEHARRLLESELGAPPTEALAAAIHDVPAVTGDRQGAVSPPTSLPGPASPPPSPDRTVETTTGAVVGRRREQAIIERTLTALRAGEQVPFLLLTGEPGIGKSHLLALLAARASSHGATVAAGRAYEAESARPYGIWIDILRSVASRIGGQEQPRELRLLLPELGAPDTDPGDRSRLFDAVVTTFQRLASTWPLVITLDDIHWLDEASCSLLHYVARQSARRPGLLLAAAARTGELDDNAAAMGLVRSLTGDDRLVELGLTGLSAAETGALAMAVAPAVDPAGIFSETAGNPLFTIALARSEARGERDLSRTLDRLLSLQFGRLRESSRDLLVRAAALDQSFTLPDLARISILEPEAMLAALGELERHGLVRPVGPDAYAFRHDLIRQAAYRGMSHPRRTLLHLQIARALLTAADANIALASDAAYHAALGNDHDVAARACIRAGEHALKVFAAAEARGFADRGLRHVGQLAQGPTTVALRMALLEIRLLADPAPRGEALASLRDDVLATVTAAEAFGLHTIVTTGHYLLSVLYQRIGDRPQAERSTLLAARAGRITEPVTQAHQLANTARCLLELETQVGRARTLVSDAVALAAVHNLELCELHWATGLLRRWDGEPEAAIAELERALALARCTEDRRREYKCLIWLTIVSFELGQTATAGRHCAELLEVASRFGETETPFAMTMQALLDLSGLTGDTAEARAKLDDALHQLRVVDDKSYLAYALNAAAGRMRSLGDGERAGAYAREALVVATVMRRQNEMAIARALLTNLGDADARAELAALHATSQDPDALSARARAAGQATMPAPADGPTPASTIAVQT